ncbi:hypothetical protein BGX34_011730, partial [Mortierella sp. NVP85]
FSDDIVQALLPKRDLSVAGNSYNLPKDQYDIRNIRECVILVKTFKTIMDEVETERYIRTSTKPLEDDEDLPKVIKQ